MSSENGAQQSNRNDYKAQSPGQEYARILNDNNEDNPLNQHNAIDQQIADQNCRGSEIQGELDLEQNKANRQNSQIDIQDEQQQIIKQKTNKSKREKRKMRNTALYDKQEREEIQDLFIQLIETINFCCTGIGKNRDKEGRRKLGEESEDNSYPHNSNNQDNANEAIKQYASTRIKRKPIRKYSHQQKQAARAKQQKLKRLEMRKNASARNPIKNPQVINEGKQEEKNIQKQKQIVNLSVQDIINRKLEEQRNLEKQEIFNNYSLYMNYAFDDHDEEIKNQPKSLGSYSTPNPLLNINVTQQAVKVQKIEVQRSKKLQIVSAKKLSIQKCIQVSVSPQNQKPE